MKHEFYTKVDPVRLEKERAYIHLHRNEIGECPYCYRNIKDRKVALYKGLIDAMYQVYKWLGEHKCHEFETKDIKHLLGQNEYARFGDLVRFGGIIYKPKEAETDQSRKAFFGMNMKRAKEFFAGDRDIPVQIEIDQITNEIVSETRLKVHDFPELSLFIKENGLYDYELKL